MASFHVDCCSYGFVVLAEGTMEIAWTTRDDTTDITEVTFGAGSVVF